MASELIQEQELQQKTILIIDDEVHILRMLEMHMRTHGYRSISALTGEEGVGLAVEKSPDLILLDVMLPGIDGVEACRRLKGNALTKRIPVIMLSAKSQGRDKINGLLGGADDYITKPFSLEELFLRIQAALRQVELLTTSVKKVYSAGSLTLDTEKYQVASNDGRIDLTLTEFRILQMLLKNRNQVVQRELLNKEIFDKESSDGGRSIDVHVRNIRKKLDAASVSGCRIETVRGTGYRI